MAIWAAVIGAVITVAATAYSTYSQNQAQVEAAKSQQKALDNQATQAAAVAAAEEEQVRTRNRIFLDSQASAAAAAGVSPNEGSPLLNTKESARYGEYNAKLAGYRTRVGAATTQQDAALYGLQAARLKSGMFGQVAGSTLATAGRSAGAFYGGYRSVMGGSTPDNAPPPA